MRRLLPFFGLLLLVISPLALAADGPQAKDHEFNPKMPARLAGRDVRLKTAQGTPFYGYAAGPENAARGILLVHEWWGLNDHIRGLADQFAAQGYRAFAIDLYDGKVTADPQVADRLRKAVRQPVANPKLRRAVEYLEAPGRKLATIGWCFGGGQSLQATLQAPAAVSATVIYYGGLVTDVAKLKTLNGPVLGIFAARDTWITPARVGAFEKAMAQAGKTLEAHSYDADHAFANPSGQRYDSAAARSAWQATKAFLDAHLR